MLLKQHKGVMLMARYTKEDILQISKEQNVKFIRLQFTDIFGTIKSVSITVEHLQKALENKCMFDGSSIEGFVRIEESDMYLSPDPNTFAILPWGLAEGKVARLICDVLNPDGTSFEGDPRFILKKAISKAKAMGYDTFNVGPECEFFLFQTDANGNITTQTHDNAGYFDLGPVDLGENARRDMCVALEELGFEVEASHHENAPGQHEIDFKYSDALTVADGILTFKFIVKSIAMRHGLHATFMPKPIAGVSGSGMHINTSLFRNGQNIFYDQKDPLQLSQEAYWFMGGLMKYIKDISAITNPIVNSYKRLLPGFEAPVNIAWSPKNRSPLIRIPAARDSSTRLELRSPDPSCNPYLAIAAILTAGLEGIKNKMQPPPPMDTNIYSMTKEQRRENNIDSLPTSLKEAIFEMENSSLAKDILGEHIYYKYIEAKKVEWEKYSASISQWEIEQYLPKY
jgi:glutamine synthetase